MLRGRLWGRNRGHIRPQATHPIPDHVLTYASRPPELAVGRHPVSMRQLDRHGRSIDGAGERLFCDHDTLEGFARRMDNIVPGAKWGFRYLSPAGEATERRA